MHVQGSLLKRVRAYVQSIVLPRVDRPHFQDRRDALFQFISRGDWNSDRQKPSRSLLDCLKLLRKTIAPEAADGVRLVGRVGTPMEQLLPLHMFLTRHQRPGCNPPPLAADEEVDNPSDLNAVARATATAEQHAFIPPCSPAVSPQPTQEQQQQTLPSNRSYMPIASLGRKFAWFDGNVARDMCSRVRLDAAKASDQVSVTVRACVCVWVGGGGICCVCVCVCAGGCYASWVLGIVVG